MEAVAMAHPRMLPTLILRILYTQSSIRPGGSMLDGCVNAEPGKGDQERIAVDRGDIRGGRGFQFIGA